MKKSHLEIGFIFTNFNNSQITIQAIDSIKQNNGWENFAIVIVDNCSDKQNVDLLKPFIKKHSNIHIIFNNDNLGYFKGLNVGIKYLKNQFTNIAQLIIGNNDLVFPKDFIHQIERNKEILNKYAVVSPNIVTLDGIHQNPHVIARISRFRELIYDLYFSNYHLALIIKRFAKITNKFTDRNDELQHEIPQTIYQGYGACYILTPIFFQNFEYLWAPTFLMNEELFLSKQLESKNLKILYEPSIVVQHCLHATMDTVPSRKKWEIARESYKEYRKYITIWR